MGISLFVSGVVVVSNLFVVLMIAALTGKPVDGGVVAYLAGGIGAGSAVGAVWGMIIAVAARDGIWPGVWAEMIITFAILGGLLGAIIWGST